MRYDIGLALLSAALFGASWAWRHHALARQPGLRRLRTQALGEMIDIRLADLARPVAVKVPIGAIRRRPF